MLQWFQDHEGVFWWLTTLSAITFVGTLIMIPMLAIRIPAGYFTRRKRYPAPWRDQHPALRYALLGLKNVIGALFVAAGVVMLILPGQGILTILIGVLLIDFPGKYRLEQWLVRHRSVMRALNWMRARAKRPPLRFPPRRGEEPAEDTTENS